MDDRKATDAALDPRPAMAREPTFQEVRDSLRMAVEAFMQCPVQMKNFEVNHLAERYTWAWIKHQAEQNAHRAALKD